MHACMQEVNLWPGIVSWCVAGPGMRQSRRGDQMDTLSPSMRGGEEPQPAFQGESAEEVDQPPGQVSATDESNWEEADRAENREPKPRRTLHDEIEELQQSVSESVRRIQEEQKAREGELMRQSLIMRLDRTLEERGEEEDTPRKQEERRLMQFMREDLLGMAVVEKKEKQ